MEDVIGIEKYIEYYAIYVYLYIFLLGCIQYNAIYLSI